MKIKSMYIKNIKALKDFKIDFNNNVNVVIGENGLGKTTILEAIYNIITANGTFLKDESSEGCNLGILFTEEELDFINRRKNETILKREEKITINNHQINRDIDFKKNCAIPTIVKARWFIASNILIDEPELSLHPEWQQKILDFYKSIGKNNQIIIATHSPHIVSSCKKEEVIVLDRNDGKTVVKSNVEETYGWTVEQLLISVFELKSVRNPEVQEKIDRFKSLYISKKRNYCYVR